MPSRQRLISIVVVLGCIVAAAIVWQVFSTTKDRVSTIDLTFDSGTAQSVTYKLENVTTLAKQAQGLSGRAGLTPNSGMIFSYDTVAQRCMWMKDMKFNIDIVWFNSSYQVSDISADLSPQTYPQTYCADAKYVVELPSGQATKHNLRVGQIVKL